MCIINFGKTLKPLRMIDIFANLFNDIQWERTFFLRQQNGKEIVEILPRRRRWHFLVRFLLLLLFSISSVARFDIRFELSISWFGFDQFLFIHFIVHFSMEIVLIWGKIIGNVIYHFLHWNRSNAFSSFSK